MADWFSALVSKTRDVLGLSPALDPPLSPSQREEQLTFLAAIQADIDDDGPRLIYAGWLDEQGGKSRAARAEFIRVQCSHGRSIGRWPHERESGRDVDLLRRWGRLWMQEYSAFTKRQLGVDPHTRCLEYQVDSNSWRRGFVEHLGTHGTPYHENDAAANCFPLLRSWSCVLWERDVERFRAIVATSDVANLKELYLVGDGVGDHTVRMLANSPYCPRLSSLGLSLGPLSVSGVATLLNSPLAASLTNLNLTCRLHDEAVQLLANAPALRALEELYLCDNQITDVGAMALAESPYLNGLRYLCLENILDDEATNNVIGEAGRSALRRSRRLGDGCQFGFPNVT